MSVERPKGRQPIPPHAKMVFHGELFDVYQWEQKMFDGSTAVFEKLKRTDTVSVVPVLENRKLLVIEDEQPGRELIISFPGGRLDTGETAEEAGRRELLEETGFEVGELLPWKAIQPVSKVDWALYFFIARGCKKISEAHLDAGERISVREVALDELFVLMDDPRFVEGELLKELLPAKYSPAARAKLEQTLFGG